MVQAAACRAAIRRFDSCPRLQIQEATSGRLPTPNSLFLHIVSSKMLRVHRDIDVVSMAKIVVKGEDMPKPIGPYSPAIKAGDFVFCAGQVGRDPATGEMGVTIEEQTRQALVNLQTILEAAGASLEDAVKTTVFMADMNEFSRMNEEYKVLPRRSFCSIDSRGGATFRHKGGNRTRGLCSR